MSFASRRLDRVVYDGEDLPVLTPCYAAPCPQPAVTLSLANEPACPEHGPSGCEPVCARCKGTGRVAILPLPGASGTVRCPACGGDR